MGLVLQNLQKIVPVKRSRLRRDVEILRHIMGIQKFDLGVICVDNRKMQQINFVYRNKRSPTDVLSFPLYQVNWIWVKPHALNVEWCCGVGCCVFLGLETWKTTVSSSQRRAEPRGHLLRCGVYNDAVPERVLRPLPVPDCECLFLFRLPSHHLKNFKLINDFPPLKI